MLRSAMGYLAAADATAMAAETQAQCLRALEQLHAIETAARASVLGALAHDRADAAGSSPRAWLIRETGITTGAATGHAAWLRRATAHPLVTEALAEVFGGIYTLSRRPRLAAAVPGTEAVAISAIAI